MKICFVLWRRTGLVHTYLCSPTLKWLESSGHRPFAQAEFYLFILSCTKFLLILEGFSLCQLEAFSAHTVWAVFLFSLSENLELDSAGWKGLLLGA